MKRITSLLALLACLTVPGWSSGMGPWDQAQPCYPVPGETCETDIGETCRDHALHIYIARLDECFWAANPDVCRAMAALQYEQALVDCH